jgi:hypothetical protein
VNAAPSIFSTELRVVINRRYVRQLLTEGWTFALAVTGPDVVVSSAFASFRAAVEHVLTDYDDAYEKSVYEAGKS